MERIVSAVLTACAVFTIGLGQPTTPQLPPGHPGVKPPAPVPRAEARPDDVASIDAIVGAMYEATSGAPGLARDWERYWSLFAPEARLISARPGADGGAWAMVLTAENYQDANKNYFEKGGHFDKEVARRVESFGNIAQVWSTYESRNKAEDPAPYARGINSIQLLKDGNRWWIVNVFWEFERPDSPVPERYLESPKE